MAGRLYKQQHLRQSICHGSTSRLKFSIQTFISLRYISDCTSPGSRSHIFSRFGGVYYLGFAVGPMIGAFLIRHPPSFPFIPASHSQSVAPVFWVAMICSFVNFLLAAFVFPESLHKNRKLTLERQEEQQQFKTSSDSKGFIGGFVKPLMIFAPKMKHVPGRTPRRDWTLTCLGLAVFMYYLSMVNTLSLGIFVPLIMIIYFAGSFPAQISLCRARF